MLVRGVTFLCIVVGFVASQDSLFASTNLTTICLHNGTTNAVSLDCRHSAVILLQGHRFGFQGVTSGDSCSPVPEDECSHSSPDVEVQLVDACMGRASCSVQVDPIFLNACGRFSDYISVQYTCVPDNSVDERSIVDVCGEFLMGNAVSRSHGSIQTPNYPNPYPPDLTCTCHLNTLQEYGRLFLTIHDLQLASRTDDMCVEDWLEYGTVGTGWGQGHKGCERPVGERFEVGTSSVQLNFHTNGIRERRGFWMSYEGEGVKNEPVEVRLECSQIQPIIEKKAVLCLHNQNVSEIYLDCTEVGVIEVITAVEGFKEMQENAICDYVTDGQCEVGAANHHQLMRMCMGASECAVGVDMIPLPRCGEVESNYMQVDYKCIPNNHDPSVIVDVCGDSMTRGNLRRRHGYLESPNYPADYPPDVACFCHLATDRDAIIRLRILDMELEGANNGKCGEDWLQTRRPHQAWGTGSSWCDTTSGHWIHTDNNELVIDFHSGSEGELRGFWAEYSAITHSGLSAPVNVICKQYNSVYDGVGGTDLTKRVSTQRSPNKGLIIGLVVILILMFIVVGILIAVKRKRAEDKLQALEQPPIQTLSKTTTDRTPSRQRRSSGGERHYRTLHNSDYASSGGTSAKPGPSHLDYPDNRRKDLITVTGSNMPSSYVNSAYDGYIEGHPNPAV